MRRPLVVGNWKMHGNKTQVIDLLQALKQGYSRVVAAQLAVLVPYPFLAKTEELLAQTAIAWGAQDMSEQSDGAFTGEVSASMLLDFHCRYVTIGHSERRQYYGETNEFVAKKFAKALSSGLSPILCVGESQQEREMGKTQTVIAKQLASVLQQLDKAADLSRAAIAYEPIWAIGTGNQATPEQAQAVHAFLREQLRLFDATLADKLAILYGGSLKLDNAAAIFAMPDVDGGLIGGASLHPEQFLGIGELCNNLYS